MLRTERMQIERERDLNRGEIMFRGGGLNFVSPQMEICDKPGWVKMKGWKERGGTGGGGKGKRRSCSAFK